MKNKRRQIGISRKTANNLIYAVAILYTLMNVVVIALTALDGIADREEVAHLAAHLSVRPEVCGCASSFQRKDEEQKQNGRSGSKSRKLCLKKTNRPAHICTPNIRHPRGRPSCFPAPSALVTTPC